MEISLYGLVLLFFVTYHHVSGLASCQTGSELLSICVAINTATMSFPIQVAPFKRRKEGKELYTVGIWIKDYRMNSEISPNASDVYQRRSLTASSIQDAKQD